MRRRRERCRLAGERDHCLPLPSGRDLAEPFFTPAGTALGSFLTRHTGLIYTGMGIYFVGALALGSWFWFGLNRPKRDGDVACPTCMPGATETLVQETSAL